jgi:hypothetical protein
MPLDGVRSSATTIAIPAAPMLPAAHATVDSNAYKINATPEPDFSKEMDAIVSALEGTAVEAFSDELELEESKQAEGKATEHASKVPSDSHAVAEISTAARAGVESAFSKAALEVENSSKSENKGSKIFSRSMRSLSGMYQQTSC